MKDEVFAASMRTCVARIVSHGQRVSVVVRVHREEPHPEGSVLGVRGAVLKVLQVDAELVVALDGESVDLLESCVGKGTRQGKIKKRRNQHLHSARITCWHELSRSFELQVTGASPPFDARLHLMSFIACKPAKMT